MRITALQLENFRGFESLDLELDPRLTVLVAENGGGKSSVLDAVGMTLRRCIDPSVADSEAPGSLRNGAERGSVRLATDLTEVGGSPTSPTLELGRGSASYRGPAGSLLRGWCGYLPLMVHYRVGRDARDTTPGSTIAQSWEPTRAWEHAFESRPTFEAFFAWFREREDLENETRLQGAGTDRSLDAVRDAVSRAVPGFTNPRIRRPRGGDDEPLMMRKPVFVVDKGGELLAFDQLSEGERTVLVMIADIARRLAIANPDGNPLEGRGIVMIDEVELHLHPKWQARILDCLLAVFPNLQFIATTHSPLVLTDVKAEQVRVLQDFKVYRPAHPVQGRDAGSILAEVFQTNPLPTQTQVAVAQISSLIDADRFDEARAQLEELERKLGGLDVEVTRLRTAIDLLAS